MRIIFYFIWRQIHFHASFICTLRTFFDAFPNPPLLFVIFLVTLTTASYPLTYGFPKKKKKKIFLEIHQINLGCTFFDRVGRKSKKTIFFFRPKCCYVYRGGHTREVGGRWKIIKKLLKNCIGLDLQRSDRANWKTEWLFIRESSRLMGVNRSRHFVNESAHR